MPYYTIELVKRTISLQNGNSFCKVMELLIEQTLLGEIDKEKQAIERILYFKNKIKEHKNIVAFSGGKDSIVLKDLVKRSGIEAEYIYSPPSVDPPELINYIKKYHPDVKWQKYIRDREGKEITMWTLIPKKMIPPSRITRYCCDFMKERTGEEGDTVYLGVRWSESLKRKKLSMVGFWKKKIVVRPLIDWSNEDIWEYIKKYNLPYCNLYDKGFKRLGCIGCPLSSNQKRELELYPAYKENYIRAFNKMIAERKRRGKRCEWKNGEEVLNWWVGDNYKKKELEGQCTLFGD
ncbi:phosphoadenosine phosphosulfate reductase family protein [uncultured Clostridium sp.]|uniref:phosphoadenosine phosphosulfate reductase family protein n=1 Tax=uncultured Clostridium sp. TaxID=59620 RepID=UPI0027315F66|nr:phosphoadenosine phosphosulfate reductase family protein [uncultured Clostridium sp.]